MNTLEHILTNFSDGPIPILENTIPVESYVPLDLSADNTELRDFDITDPESCQSYIDNILKSKAGKVAYGGYLEVRNLYKDKSGFNQNFGEPRNIHLGIDYWATEGTEVFTPLNGVVHSFKNNSNVGDYGPTIILEHSLEDFVFYTLYGHLSLESLVGLSIGKKFEAKSVLATLGNPEINVNYAPHLHFQIIKDLQGSRGDYPGVCSKQQLDFYRNNCIDPNLLLKIR